jgi:plasmid replication initiation protein
LQIEIPPPQGYKKAVWYVVAGYEDPILVKGKSVLNIYIPKNVAPYLINIDKTNEGKAREYHHYLYEVVMSSKKKYTFKLYWLISQWKNNTGGGFRILYQDLRNILGLGQQEYADYSDFKRRILLPAQQELTGKADCWFNCTTAGFEYREGKKVTALNFKVIFPVLETEIEENKHKLIYWLKTQLKLNNEHIQYLSPIFPFLSNERYTAITTKCVALIDLYYKRLGGEKEIKDLPSYIAFSLLKEFCNA